MLLSLSLFSEHLETAKAIGFNNKHSEECFMMKVTSAPYFMLHFLEKHEVISPQCNGLLLYSINYSMNYLYIKFYHYYQLFLLLS
jgi:hypothetical protein